MFERERAVNLKKVSSKNIKMMKQNNIYIINVFNLIKVEVGCLFNGKVNPNSLEIIKVFAEQVAKSKPIDDLSKFTKYSQMDILTYSFETLPISKEIYFKVKNQNNETILVAKHARTRNSLTDLFGNSSQLVERREDIKKVVKDIQKIIRIDEESIYKAFPDFEFLIHENNTESKVIFTINERDRFGIYSYENEFSRLSLSFRNIRVAHGNTKKSSFKQEYQVTFDDIYCMDEIIEQLKEIGNLFTNEKVYTDKGIHIPYGLLLVGEPGAGKTLVTRAFANEYNIRIIEPVIGDRYSEGVDSIDWNQTFYQARMNRPSIVFIDEIDKIKITQELYKEMDGQISNHNILVIACANDISSIHPAILRPGRFDRKIFFQPLSNETKATMLLKVLEKNKTPYNIDFEYLVEFMGSVNGSYIDTYVNEARIKMELNHKDVLTDEMLLSVIEVVNHGFTMPIKLKNDEMYQTIVHEAGHALVALAIYGKDAIIKIDVRSNHYSLGRVQLSSRLPMHNQTAIINQIKISLGGLIAEKMYLKEAGFGASSDLLKARRMLESMIVNHGIFDVRFGGANMFQGIGYSGTEESKNLAIDLANEVLEQCQKDVEEIIENHYDLLKEIIDKLKSKPLLLKNDIDKLSVEKIKSMQESDSSQLYLNKLS